MKLSETSITTVKSAVLQNAARAMDYLAWLISREIRMFELFGIEFSLNSTVILLPVIMVAYLGLDWHVPILVLGAAASILLHEMGHALGGYIVGNHAKKIGLIACGGYTLFEEPLGTTAEDALIGLFGPLANAMAVIALMMAEASLFGCTSLKWLKILLFQVFDEYPSIRFLPDSFFIFNALAMTNMYMFLFNLVPAFPLDGGRCLRVLAGRFLPPLTAATATMFVARVLACAIVVRGVIIDLMLDFDIFDMLFMILVAVWIWFGSAAEVWRTEQEEASSMKDPCLDADCILEKKNKTWNTQNSTASY